MKSFFHTAWLSLLFISTIANAQKLPERPNPPRLVNDYVNLLSQAERNQLERKLVAFNDSTSTQIAVVIIDDLQGLEPQEYATQLGNNWGVGQKGKSNGVLVLLCPKSHKLFTASGYGAEGMLPDLRIQDIENAVMFPEFKLGNYYTGLDKGTSLMIASFKGEYKADPNARKRGRGKNDSGVGIIIFIAFFFFIVIISRLFSKRGGSHIASKGVPWWMWLFLLNSGGSRGSSWSDFNSGSGGFGGGGGGGGGFGGFGGGSFGGGGAGGSW